MPLIFHEIDSKELKKTLINRYCIDFNSISTDLSKIKNNVSKKQLSLVNKSLNNNEYIDVSRELVKLSLRLCESILPANWNDFFGKKQILSKTIKEECQNLYMQHDNFGNILNKFDFIINNEATHIDDSLLMYVAMDAFLHVHKKLSGEADKQKSESQRSFYTTKIATDNISDYKNVMNNDKTYRNIGLLKIHHNFKTINGVPASDVSSFLIKTAFLLIKTIKANPYRKKINKDGTEEYPSINLNKLITFFSDRIYKQIRNDNNDDFNFKADEPAIQVASYYYLDLLFDFDNFCYIAKKLSENDDISGQYLNEIINVMYQCILIPSTFSKKLYINKIFIMLGNKSIVYSDYKNFRAKNPVLENLGDHFQKSESQIKQKNLLICREYIQYLSKIYFPVLSACFYVLLFEVFGNDQKNAFINIYGLLSYIAEKNVLPYYDNQYANIKKTADEFQEYLNAEEQYKYVKEKKFDEYLSRLYEATRLNIYDNEKYDDVYNSLKIDADLSPSIRMHILNQLIDSKISANVDNISDPIPNEDPNQKQIAIYELYSNILEDYRNEFTIGLMPPQK